MDQGHEAYSYAIMGLKNAANAKEIDEIVHDIELILSETDGRLTGEQVRAIVVLAQMNLN